MFKATLSLKNNIELFVHPTFLLFILLSFFSWNTYADINDQTIMLTPQQESSTTSLVTVGIPFSTGQLNNVKNIRVFDDQNKEVNIFVKPTLYWHWKPFPDNTIRAIKLQFFFDQSKGASNYRFTINTARNTTLDIEEQVYDLGTKVSDLPTKAGMRTPNVIAMLNTRWLEQSNIIPPFLGVKNDSQFSFWKSQLAQAKELDFTQKNIANWLFDRVSALYKGCMRTSDSSCYSEAFLSYRYWINQIKREGGVTGCQGGLNISTNEQKACDTKYVYIEPIKIHLALTGDDTLFDQQLIEDMSTLVQENFYYQTDTSDLYDAQNESFTERAAGLSLLAQVSAFELTANEQILSNIYQRLNSLYLHQTNNPDSFDEDGTYRHSWAKHEGATYPGDDNIDDRRFSPWMIENIIDALWHSYHVVEDDRIPEMLRMAGNAIEKWGFADSQGYTNKFGSSLHDLPNGQSWRHSCNQGGSVVLYSGSSIATSEQLLKTQNNDGWYSDTHNPETVLGLALAYYFETDSEASSKLRSRILSIRDSYLNETCGNISSTKRLFNWNNRSNYWGTYLWVLEQKGETDPAGTDPGTDPGTGTGTGTGTVFDAEYFTGFDEDVLSDAWFGNDLWQVSDGAITSNKAGIITLNDNTDAGSHYSIELDIIPLESGSADKGILFSNEGTTFYSVRVKAGQYGGISLYKHIASWDLGGELIESKSISPLILDHYKLKILVQANNVKVYLADTLYINYDNTESFSGKNNGIFSQGNKASVDNFHIKYNAEPLQGQGSNDENYLNYLPIYFDSFDAEIWQESNWNIENNNISVERAGLLLLNETLNLNSSYEMEIDMSANQDGKFGLSLLFNNNIDEYYTVRIFSGEWGGVYIYKHSAIWDLGGKVLAKNTPHSLLDNSYRLKLVTNKNNVSIYLNDELYLSHTFSEEIKGTNVGLHTLGNLAGMEINQLALSY